jgi:hypothetical protein
MIRKTESKDKQMWEIWDQYLREQKGSFPGKMRMGEPEDQDSLTVHLKKAGNFFGSTMRLPKKATRAHFKAIIDHHAGFKKWAAGFEGQIWNRHERTPDQGQIIEVIWSTPPNVPPPRLGFQYSKPEMKREISIVQKEQTEISLPQKEMEAVTPLDKIQKRVYMPSSPQGSWTIAASPIRGTFFPPPRVSKQVVRCVEYDTAKKEKLRRAWEEERDVTRKEMLFEDWILLQPIKETPNDWWTYALTQHQAGLKRTLEQEQAWNRHQEEARFGRDCRRLEMQAPFVSPPSESLSETTQQGFFSQWLEKKTEVDAQGPTSRSTNHRPSTEDHKVSQESSLASHDQGLPTPQTEVLLRLESRILRRRRQREARKTVRPKSNPTTCKAQEESKEVSTDRQINGPQTGHGWTYDPDPKGRRRGILTDRPPDKPPPCKGRFSGNSFGRANSPAQESRSSSLCASTSLRDVAAPLDTIHVKVQMPSNFGAFTIDSISQQTVSRKGRRPGYSCRSRGTGYACGTQSPFSYLGRSLFLCGGFSSCACRELSIFGGVIGDRQVRPRAVLPSGSVPDAASLPAGG